MKNKKSIYEIISNISTIFMFIFMAIFIFTYFNIFNFSFMFEWFPKKIAISLICISIFSFISVIMDIIHNEKYKIKYSKILTALTILLSAFSFYLGINVFPYPDNTCPFYATFNHDYVKSDLS